MAAGFYSRRSRARDGAEPQLPKLLSVWSGGQPRPDSLIRNAFHTNTLEFVGGPLWYLLRYLEASAVSCYWIDPDDAACRRVARGCARQRSVEFGRRLVVFAACCPFRHPTPQLFHLSHRAAISCTRTVGAAAEAEHRVGRNRCCCRRRRPSLS